MACAATDHDKVCICSRYEIMCDLILNILTVRIGKSEHNRHAFDLIRATKHIWRLSNLSLALHASCSSSRYMADWLSILESMDLTRSRRTKATSRSERYTPVPDSILEGAHHRLLSALETYTGVSTSTSRYLTLPVGMQRNHLGMQLDKMADSVTGKTVVDPKCYLTDLTDVSDIRKARQLDGGGKSRRTQVGVEREVHVRLADGQCLSLCRHPGIREVAWRVEQQKMAFNILDTAFPRLDQSCDAFRCLMTRSGSVRRHQFWIFEGRYIHIHIHAKHNHLWFGQIRDHVMTHLTLFMSVCSRLMPVCPDIRWVIHRTLPDCDGRTSPWKCIRPMSPMQSVAGRRICLRGALGISRCK